MQHSGFSMQPNAVARSGFVKLQSAERLGVSIEADRVLGLGQILAEENLSVGRRAGEFLQRTMDGIHHLIADGTRFACGLECRITVQARKLNGVSHEGEKCLAQLLPGGRSKTDGIGHALAYSHALMRVLRRQIKHIARIENEFLLGFEMPEDFQGQIVAQSQILLRADAPASLSMGLQEKNVIGIHVGADAAAVSGLADHQVIKAAVGNEAELMQQLICLIIMQIHALHE